MIDYVNSLIDKMNETEVDDEEFPSTALELVDALLSQCNHLQLFITSKGITKEDYEDYLKSLDNRTIH